MLQAISGWPLLSRMADFGTTTPEGQRGGQEIELMLSSTSRQDSLQPHLDGLTGSIVGGVLVGAGSIILHIQPSGTLLPQCPFEVGDGHCTHSGHGERPQTAVALFVCLNRCVEQTRADPAGVITLTLDGDHPIRISPEENGFKSFVVSTSAGVFPVIGPA